MRCRAWLGTRFCKNEAKDVFCYVHKHHSPFVNFFNKLPALVIECITKHIQTAETRQTLRISSKTLHEVISKAQFQISKEYLYFERFFLRPVVTRRQAQNAFQRFSKLSPEIQNILKDELQVEIRTIIGCLTMRDLNLYGEQFRAISPYASWILNFLDID